MGVDGSGWEWMGVVESGWEWMRVGGSGWEWVGAHIGKALCVLSLFVNQVVMSKILKLTSSF